MENSKKEPVRPMLVQVILRQKKGAWVLA